MTTRHDCLARDQEDRLAPLRGQFDLDAADGRAEIYLDGNSLGALPRTTAARVREVVEEEWGSGLVRSWNTAGWIDLSRRVGDRIAPLVGAGPGEVIVADSTSVNLFKALSAAVALAAGGAPERCRIVSERANFPTDLYIAGSLAAARDLELVLVDTDELAPALDDRVAVLLLTHVNYRTGRMHLMGEMTRAAHAAGALVVWDLAHSAGAVPVDLSGGGVPGEAADFAVGCGYKFLNGGPGAPAFLWVHPRHTARLDAEGWRPPLAGWLGHADPFAFEPEYRPAAGVARFVCGTPPVLSLAALECGVETVRAANAHGGMAAIREKGTALTELFVDLVEERVAGHDLEIVSPRQPLARGSQVCLSHPTGAYPMAQALIARGVVGDFRAPDILRFGFAPLYTRFIDVWDAVDRLAAVLETGEWRESRFGVRSRVT